VTARKRLSPATKAGLDANRRGIGPAGSILIADYNDHRIRRIAG
jgi:hypothetical protein